MSASIRFEDRLDGISNYMQCKVRLISVFKENKIYSYVNYVVVAPVADPIALELCESKEFKAQRMFLYGVKNENRKMSLKAKLHDTKMGKEESVSSYLNWVAQVKDELAVIGETTIDFELVRIALNGFTKE
jgi:hypothetical protein